ncbi:hypothetical protein [Flavobacterium ajazii]|uniref:hypothetical protein n=1 Tax=Flavobacterium ajazii TaxID=2692318 RepID=UPI0013D6E6D6|nr:hypothetical protein [Flavobacterium ajazii]
MIELIIENKFDKLKEYLKDSKDFQIHKFLLEVLEGNEKIEIDGESFDAVKFQEEFLEGLRIYLTLQKSNLNDFQFKAYSSVLVELTFKMCGFIRLMADKAMENGVYLSDLEDVYKVNPVIRQELQVFIDVLKSKNESNSVANVAAGKAQVTNSIQNLLEKFEIGEDMLQFAESYEKVGQIEFAADIYKGIINDFECDSVKFSSGIFPEISHIDTRSQKEIDVFEKAKLNLVRIIGENVQNEAPNIEDNDKNNNKYLNDKRINDRLYQEIYDSSVLLLKSEKDASLGLLDALSYFSKVSTNEDLNDVTDIYIYEESFSKSDDQIKNTFLHAITALITDDYKVDNFKYLEEIILKDKTRYGEGALRFILNIGRYKEKFKSDILNFLDKNLASLSKNQTSILAYFLVELYVSDYNVVNLLNKINKKEGVSLPTVPQKKLNPIVEEKTIVTQTKSFEMATPWWKFW